MPSELSKNQIRQGIKWLWRISPKKDIKLREELALYFIKEADFFKKAVFVLAYCPSEYELNFVQKLLLTSPNKLYYFPKIIENRLAFFSAKNFDNFTKNYLGILEPLEIGEELNMQKGYFNSALMFVPSLAADLSLSRLGRGRGFYDRFLANCPNSLYKAAILPDFCVTDANLPVEKHDKPLDLLISVGHTQLEVINKS